MSNGDREWQEKKKKNYGRFYPQYIKKKRKYPPYDENKPLVEHNSPSTFFSYIDPFSVKWNDKRIINDSQVNIL
jgi:hypothetical protein